LIGVQITVGIYVQSVIYLYSKTI